jgi:predicted metal-dependent hydrolase
MSVPRRIAAFLDLAAQDADAARVLAATKNRYAAYHCQQVGLAHAIVDIVETGTTLRENDLEVLETVAEVSTQLIANRASYKLRAAEIRPLVEKLRAVVG